MNTAFLPKLIGACWLSALLASCAAPRTEAPPLQGTTSLKAKGSWGARIMVTARLGGGVSTQGGRIQRVATPLTDQSGDVLTIENERVRGYEITREEGGGDIELQVFENGEASWSGVLQDGQIFMLLERRGDQWAPLTR